MISNDKKTAIIVGAGPSGLTAAYELISKTDIKPVIFEASDIIGGIARTVNYKGNRIDIGGHRFFSKSDTVMQWWENIFPLQGAPAKDDLALNRYVPLSNLPSAPNPEKTDKVMLIRNRYSRIFFSRMFFNYPSLIHPSTVANLGIKQSLKIAVSYLASKIRPLQENNLEDFFINRFGREMYFSFFKYYTEKVWGMPCNEINAEWGKQRIKDVSISKLILYVVKNIFSLNDGGVKQKDAETSLIDYFLYPKLGPGQFWNEVARIIEEKGGEIHLSGIATDFKYGNGRINEVRILDKKTGKITWAHGDYFFSSMPVSDFITALGHQVPAQIRIQAKNLKYRDFIILGLLLKKLNLQNHTNSKTINNITPDNWIYIQDSDVRLSRIQIYNNWSPYLVADTDTVWIGAEYCCNEGDQLWNKSDKEFSEFGIEELIRIGFIKKEDILDAVVIKVPKAYPVYDSSYKDFPLIRAFTDTFENLFLIGRNGMHRYNNMDHSILTAIIAVSNIINNISTKENIWSVTANE